MKTCIKIFILLSVIFNNYRVEAQHYSICGSSRLMKEFISHHDTIKVSYKIQYERLSPIPIIFHILLDTSQYIRIGGISGIEARIDSQIAVINRDFNGLSDTTNLPNIFKSLYTSVGLSFALASIDPNGNKTRGYDLKIISNSGIEYNGRQGSKIGFSDCKYDYQGLKVWDPYRYLNIWIVNTKENGFASNIAGLTIPFSLSLYYSSLPLDETGIVLHYGAFGVQNNSADYFLPGSSFGHTLTHELGHFFELKHIWGDDEGLCPNNGGQDDGINDTPPQSTFTFGCPTFPKFDACSPNNSGILFMNYMDYANDKCKCIFTLSQANKIQNLFTTNSPYYYLTQHPHLIMGEMDNNIDNIQISPNPVKDIATVIFPENPVFDYKIQITDVQGKVMFFDTHLNNFSYYYIDFSKYSSGIYFIHCQINGKLYYSKITKS